jgi:hypothetical protein
MRNVLHCLLHQHQNSPQNQTVSVAEMVKKRVGGKARFAAALSGSGRKAAKVEAKEQAKDRPAPPKHLQRKIARKVGFLEKVAASKVTLKGRVQKRQRKNDVGKALGGLRESLGGALQEVERQHAEHQDKHKQMGEAVKSSKARLKIQQTETARVKQVSHDVKLVQACPAQSVS